ncbi:hypothetical protein L210DRAFT_2707347 [Boletus edulis BED1]|uniref:Uncharacterized protein n=1 Tax=Boletus edulis BED1 TaxID=1328754 RepID=A0AAD4GAQ4_BOLED|nr:hypothetical protein L210DRAFT_2707347 [Boletus edulis BED1]
MAKVCMRSRSFASNIIVSTIPFYMPSSGCHFTSRRRKSIYRRSKTTISSMTNRHSRPGHARAPDRTLDDQPSWSASLESPMERLKSELQSFAREEEEASARQDVSSLTDSLMYERKTQTLSNNSHRWLRERRRRALPDSIVTNPKPRFSPPIFLRVHCRPLVQT